MKVFFPSSPPLFVPSSFPLLLPPFVPSSPSSHLASNIPPLPGEPGWALVEHVKQVKKLKHAPPPSWYCTHRWVVG